MRIVAPETWYRIWWLLWTLIVFLAARWWLVNPIVDAIRELKK